MTTPPPPPPPPPSSGPAGQPNSNDDRTLAQVAHFAMVIFGFIPALIIYLVKGDNPWVKSESAKAFNFAIIPFGINIMIGIFSRVLSLVDTSGFVSLAFACVTCFIPLALWVTMAIFGIMNGIKVGNGEETRYPFEIPILK